MTVMISHVIGNQNADKLFAKKSKATKSMPCQFFNAGSCLHPQTHKTKGVLYKHVCSACFTKNGKKISTSGGGVQEKQTGKKRVALGMGSKVRSHAHYDRSIVNTSVNKIMFNQELYADKNTYLQWYDTYRNGNKFTDGRSYAHVVSCSHPLDGRNVSAGHTARRVHSNPRCQRLPHGSEGQKRHVTTFRPSCKKPTYVSTKSSFSGKKITTLSDHDVCNTLPLANRFQVLNEIDDDTPRTNADAASPTPCHTAASSSQISDSVMLRQKIKDSSSGLLNQPLTSQFAPADREVSVHNIGFTLSEGNRVTEGEGGLITNGH